MRYALILAGLLAIASPSLAQETPSSPAASPSPTRLRAAYRGAEVILSWESAVNAPGGYAIYRSSEAITGGSLVRALRIGFAAPGDRSFADRPADRAAYFYAIFALDAGGSPFLSFEPGKNITARAVAIEPSAENPIEGLIAGVDKDSIRLRYRVMPGLGRLVLYRGTSPFSDAASLLDAVLVSSFEDRDGVFVDYPVPGVDYWYALLPESELKAGRISFRSGSNATANSAKIPAGLYRLGLPETPPLARTPPLPAFALAPSDDVNLAGRAQRLSPETEKAIAAILAPYPPVRNPLPSLVTLPEEKTPPTGGEDYALSLIVQGSLRRGDFSAAAEELQKYLSLNRGASAAARARFYLGESLAREGQYRDAFFEFLRARSNYAAETRPWIDYLIAQLHKD